jgi:hypothetical protein
MWAVAISERPPTQRFRCAAHQGRQPAQLTHCFFSCPRDLLGKALPLAAVVWFDSARPMIWTPPATLRHRNVPKLEMGSS